MVAVVPRKPSAGLSFRAAAARVGCTHGAISKAVTARLLPVLPDGTVAIADLDRWNANRRAPRGGLTRKQAEKTAAATATKASCQVTNFAELSDAILNVATTIDVGASDLAELLVAVLPVGLARAIVEEWAARQRAGWVGGRGCREEDTPAGEWPEAPGGGSWAAHGLFTGPAVPEVEWASLEAGLKRTTAGPALP